MTDTLNLYNYTIPKEGETFETIASCKNVKILRIISSNKLEEKVYCQAEDEWVVVLEGEATILINGERNYLSRGDSLFIPSQTSHSVLATKSGTLWLAIHIS